MMTGVDVAVRFGPTEPSSLIARKLVETRVLTCAAPAYLKQHGEPLMPQDLIQHETVLFRDPQTGRPFPWEFHRKGKVVDVQVRGRMVTDDPSTAIAACVSGYGVFQSLELGLSPWLRTGKLVPILSDWSEERYPLYAYYASRHLPPADPGIPGFRAGNHRGGRLPVRRARQSLRQSLHGHQFRMTGAVCLTQANGTACSRGFPGPAPLH
jgi:DNA-binding transcriptional LysR family regulator